MNNTERPQAVLQAASRLKWETAEMLSQLVQTKSYSGREKDVCRLIVRLCEEAGFDEVYIDGLGSVIARIGNGSTCLAFDAHIDTVEVGDESQWSFDPFSGAMEGGHVKGRGSSDQKGGAASMIAAGKILKELGFDLDYTLYFTFTVLEEDCDGLCWKYLIEEEGIKPHMIVSTEPTSCRLYRGHRGRMEMTARLKGISAHGSAPERGVSAAYKAARAVLAIEQLNENLESDEENFLGKGTIVVSQVDVHGPSQCAVPDQAMIYLDRRLTWGETAETAMAQVKECISEAVGDSPEDIAVTMPWFDKQGWMHTDYGQELYFPTWKMPEDHWFVQAGKAAYKSLFDAEPAIDKWTFSTNLVSATGRHGIPAIGFGPGDEDQAHAPNEVTRIDDLVQCAAFYAMLPYAVEKKL